MSDSSSFSSLLALVDSHLSKVSVQSNQSEEDENTTKIVSSENSAFPDFGHGSFHRLSIPSISLSNNPVKNEFAEQVANMMRAKRKKEEEEAKAAVPIKVNDEHEHDPDNDVIDLMEALRKPFQPRPMEYKEESSSHSSLESLFEPKFLDCDVDTESKDSSPQPVLLPCQTDMSFIMNMKIPTGKCSSFGKVLASKYRPRAIPYVRSTCSSTIKRFTFETKSPCDLLKEKHNKNWG